MVFLRLSGITAEDVVRHPTAAPNRLKPIHLPRREGPDTASEACVTGNLLELAKGFEPPTV